MNDDNDFKPRLGKIRSPGAKGGRSYVNRVIRALALAGGRPKRGKSKFKGNQSGRGAGAGRVLGGRDRYSAFRQRRVIIKSRFVRVKGKSARGPQDHLRYIQRDGVTREGTPGELYDKAHDRADGAAFLERGKDDRHQFRFIVSPEDGDRYEDLKPVIRRLMARMEEDLGTALDWVAVDHFNTGHPHAHIVLAGRDDRGRDLVIAREYIGRGMRERACEIVTFDFGPRTDLEIEHRLQQEVEQERLTSIDRRLLVEAEDGGPVRSNREGLSAFQQTLRAGRLQKLKRLGLADEAAPGLWTLDGDLESRLRDMGLRGDIIKTMHRAMTEKNLGRSAAEYVIYDPHRAGARELTGRIAAVGYFNELTERQYVILDGTDGYAHYVDLGVSDETPGEGAIVTVSAKSLDPKDVDRRIVEIAAANGGRYDLDIHLRHERHATADFAETHVRRLEAIRRATGKIARSPEGTWTIAPDHLERVRDFERHRARNAPVILAMLSRLSIEQQIGTDGATWLDRELTATTPALLRDSGFGKEMHLALNRRTAWLLSQGLAAEEHSGVVYRANLLAILQRRELVRAGAQLADDLGLRHVEAPPRARIEGVYRRYVDLASGRFALITQEKSFMLVPWRAVLERSRGLEVSGVARGDTISWTIGRARSGPAR